MYTMISPFTVPVLASVPGGSSSASTAFECQRVRAPGARACELVDLHISRDYAPGFTPTAQW